MLIVAQFAQLLPQAPGALQRAGIGVHLGWHALIALLLLRNGTQRS